MKKVRITFEYDDYSVNASGTVWDSLYVNNLYYDIVDSNGETVYFDIEKNNDVRELAEELILQEYNEIELPF